MKLISALSTNTIKFTTEATGAAVSSAKVVRVTADTISETLIVNLFEQRKEAAATLEITVEELAIRINAY